MPIDPRQADVLRIHNSLSGRKEDFVPREPGKVGMYVCGITVYDYCHVGHARFLVVFDMVRRYLRYRGLHVSYVRNITDIDDKIIRRAAENNEPIAALTARFIAAMREDCAALGVEPPDHEPRATEHIAGMVSLIERLLERGFAYVGESGDVLYSVARFADYGRLSGRHLEDLRAGARVEIDERKRDPLDFVLWKRAREGEPAWPTPWGAGRPGWHIECSAMAHALLGEHFDLHGGGMDLKFPHHENEIAQSCAAGDGAFVNVWMHNGFVNIDSEKMSKSLGNFFTVREVLGTLRHPEVLRFFLLSSHYRAPVNYSSAQLEQADAALTRLYNALRAADAIGATTRSDGAAPATAQQQFEAALDDDFNTAEAVAVLQGLARDINIEHAAGHEDQVANLSGQLRQLAAVLGLLQVPTARWFQLSSNASAQTFLSEAQIDAQITARLAARRARDFAAADRIRGQLAECGVVLEDQPGGVTVWRRG